MLQLQMVPFINRLAVLLLPITATLTSMSDFILSVMGMKSKEVTNVSMLLAATSLLSYSSLSRRCPRTCSGWYADSPSSNRQDGITYHVELGDIKPPYTKLIVVHMEKMERKRSIRARLIDNIYKKKKVE